MNSFEEKKIFRCKLSRDEMHHDSNRCKTRENIRGNPGKFLLSLQISSNLHRYSFQLWEGILRLHQQLLQRSGYNIILDRSVDPLNCSLGS